MYQVFQNKIAAYLDHKGITEDDAIYLYLIAFAAPLFCMFVHLYMLVAFLINGVMQFVYLNIFSCLIYFILLLVYKRRHYVFIVFAITAEVSIYTTIHCFLGGISTYVVAYYLLVIILQIITPCGSIRARTTTISAIILVALASILYSLNNSLPILFSDGLYQFLTISNIYLLFIGCIMQLVIGDMITRIIARMNVLRMEELSSLANTDPLTGLYNRRHAQVLFQELLATKKEVLYCVAMVDIDDFKLVNDTHGHPCGDEVLIFLSDFLVNNLRSSDLVFRWGGEEFLIVLDNIDVSTAHKTLDVLRKKLEEATVETTEAALNITVTIGIASLDLRNPQTSIKNCDDNLYIGKQQGKNVVISS